MFRILIAITALFFTGCRPQYSDFFPYHEDGTPKPYVALLPMVSECHPPLQWDLGKELTYEVRKQLMRHGRIYIPTAAEISKQYANCSKKELTSNDLMPFLFFQPAHFVVLMELIDYRIVPYEPGKIKPLYIAAMSPSDANVLQMKVRLKIVDIRGGEPKLLRQEVIESNHVIGKMYYEESLLIHGEKGFSASALGLAEGRLTHALAEDRTHHIVPALVNSNTFSLQALVIFLVTGAFFLFFAYRYKIFRLPQEKRAWKEDFSVVSPLFALLIYFFSVGPLTALSHKLFKTTYPLVSPSVNWAASFFVGIFFACIALFLLVSIHSKTLKQRILGSGNSLWKFLQGLFLAFGVYPVTVGVVTILNGVLFFIVGHEAHEEQVAVVLLKRLPTASPTFFIALFVALFIVPCVEELLFRGFIQNYLLRFYGYKNAIIFTSIIFSLFHYSASQGLINISLLSGLFLTSLFIGAVYARFGSIWASIGLHAMFNGISMIFLLL